MQNAKGTFKKLCQLTPSQILSLYPESLPPSVISGGRAAVPGPAVTTGFQQQAVLPTSAVGMTSGRRRRAGVSAVPFPTGLKFNEPWRITSGTNNAERIVPRPTVVSSCDLKKIVADANSHPVDKSLAARLKRQQDKALKLLNLQQARLNPYKKQQAPAGSL